MKNKNELKNAIIKAKDKAKKRAVIGSIGKGILDESKILENINLKNK